jgi:hypothetical protein
MRNHSKLTWTYERCQELGISPKHIAKCIEGIVALSDEAYTKEGTATSIQGLERIFDKKSKIEQDSKKSLSYGSQSYAKLSYKNRFVKKI